MRIRVCHETLYRYDAPPSGVIQTLRLTPRNHDGQFLIDWRIDVSEDCRLDVHEDAFGNITTLTDHSGFSSSMEYDSLGLLTKMRDTKHGEMTLEFDAFGRETLRRDSQGNTLRYTYDSNGNRKADDFFTHIGMVEKVDPDGAARARERYSCFDHFGKDTQAYGYAAGLGIADDVAPAEAVEGDFGLRRVLAVFPDGLAGQDVILLDLAGGAGLLGIHVHVREHVDRALVRVRALLRLELHAPVVGGHVEEVRLLGVHRTRLLVLAAHG